MNAVGIIAAGATAYVLAIAAIFSLVDYYSRRPVPISAKLRLAADEVREAASRLNALDATRGDPEFDALEQAWRSAVERFTRALEAQSGLSAQAIAELLVP